VARGIQKKNCFSKTKVEDHRPQEKKKRVKRECNDNEKIENKISTGGWEKKSRRITVNGWGNKETRKKRSFTTRGEIHPQDRGELGEWEGGQLYRR